MQYFLLLQRATIKRHMPPLTAAIFRLCVLLSSLTEVSVKFWQQFAANMSVYGYHISRIYCVHIFNKIGQKINKPLCFVGLGSTTCQIHSCCSISVRSVCQLCISVFIFCKCCACANALLYYNIRAYLRVCWKRNFVFFFFELKQNKTEFLSLIV